MSIKESIYKKSPLFFKIILLNLYALKNNKQRYTNQFEKYLREYKYNWLADEVDIKSYQRQQLKILLMECYKYVSFYNDIFKNIGVELVDIEKDPYAVLSKMPILTKQTRKTKVESLINVNPNRKLLGIGYSSGTSGTPTIDYVDAESTERAFALWERFRNNIGVTRKDRNVRLSGRILVNPQRNNKPFWIMNYIDNQLLMSTYHLTENNMKDYVDKLNYFSPKFIDGYPSAIYILAKYINRNKIILDFIPVGIATTAETLHDYQRLEIEQAFKCKVYNQYASSEGSPFITECKKGKLHINEDSGVFELLNKNNKQAKKGELAKLVVTSFRNWKTPLLRYDIEDVVLLSKDNTLCECGCKMPYVEKIVGREDDVLWTKEKGYVGRMDTAYKGLIGIEKSQLIQETPTLLIVNNEISDLYSKSIENKLVQNLKDRLGMNIEIKVNIVENIPLGANGKFTAVKRHFQI